MSCALVGVEAGHAGDIFTGLTARSVTAVGVFDGTQNDGSAELPSCVLSCDVRLLLIACDS